MTLRQQITFMTIIPLVGLLMLGIYLSVTKFQSLRSSIQTRNFVAQVEVATEFIHVLQVERGQSAGFVASGGVNFADSLPGVRADTDALVERLPRGADALREGYAEIVDLRRRIDGQQATVPELAGQYTGLIRQAFDYSQSRLGESADPDVARLGAGAIALGEAKEAAGLQRAAGAGGFGRGSFAQGTFEAFIARGALERGLLALAAQSLPGILDADALAQMQEASGVLEMREAVAAAGADEAISGYTAPEWFGRSTAWIDDLRSLELAAFAEISERASRNQMFSTLLFVSAVILSLLSLALTAFKARSSIRAFDNSFMALTNALTRLGNGDYDGRSYKQDTQTEIGRMFVAVDETRDALNEANAKIEVQNKARQDVISRLDAALQTLAGGDLSQRVNEPFSEEFESLRQSYNQSLDRLGEALSGVQGSAGGLHSSSSELNNANEELSMRTASQAAALEETTAALAQLSEMVSGAARSAVDANAATTQLNSDAISGAEQVRDAVVAIQEIAESTRKMTGMIGLIEDIAFQTSLLALNAGVEAARAGEAGKGFAVVASEVRSLAVRATETTVEIKSLIGSATDRTENGVALVERAGEVFSSITESVAQAANSVENIASDAENQATSIDEIKAAMFDLDRVTQENAAMVDGSLEISERLKSDADELWQIVAQFSLQGTGHGAAVTGYDTGDVAA